MSEAVGTGFLNEIMTMRAVRSTRSRHAVLVAFLSFVFYILCHLNEDVDNRLIWWFMHACLLGFFYLFLQLWVQPLTGKPSYIRFNKWLVLWILPATTYHLPVSRYVGVSMRMNPSIFVTTSVFSVLLLLVCHLIYEGLHCIVSLEARKWPDIWTIVRPIWTILLVSAVVNVLCCVHLRDYRERPHAKRYTTLASNWLHGGSPSEIFLVFELWAEVMAICIVCYIYAGICRLSTSRKKKQMKPAFLDMVPWYSGTSADLYKTVFNLVVSLKFFLGRFDGRILQATTNHFEDGPQQRDFLYTQLSKEEELWFDFIADTGDGGNSTYTIARLLAKPSICFPNSNLNLKRGNLLLIGGDIAYPNPSELTYEKRLFLPFEYALQTPPLHEEDHNSSQVMPYDGPKCFIIPGNHDWLDGLHTFSKYVCHKNWLGGWHMLQRKSYFALELPKRWWVFGLDLALLGDIDVYQFEFFKKLVEKKVGEKDSVIVMTHQPDWLLNWYENNGDSKNNVHSLINILKERCKLRIAGDIHHYMHHSIVKSDGPASSQPDKKPVYVQHLLVNGCGGAFAHPTHVFHEFSESHGVSYECKAAYPSFKTSKRLALGNIWNFRKENWQFDFVGGVIYFTLAISMFPQCELDHIFQVDTISDRWRSFSGTMWNAFIYMLEHSYVSLGSAMLLLTMAIAFVPRKVSWRTRIMMGILHVSAHVAAALCLRLVLELGVEMLVRHELLETSGYHSLYRRYQSIESRYFPVSNGTRARVEQWTFGLYPASIKYLLFAFDVPELMAVTRSNICKNGLESISRWGVIIYYASGLLYFWVLSTPFVSFVFGSYLYICMNWFNLHYDEGFSSLRIPDYKAVTRFHITPNGDLEVFTLGVDKVPEDWTLDPEFEKEEAEENKCSHEREFPSKWRAAAPYQDPKDIVRIIEKFVIEHEEDDQMHDIDSKSEPTNEATGSSTIEED